MRVGEKTANEYVRAMILIRINILIKGYSGIRVCVIQRLVDVLNHNLIPMVPQKGSVGASGDLCPLSHMCSALFYGVGLINDQPATDFIGEGKQFPILELMSKEGLSLIMAHSL